MAEAPPVPADARHARQIARRQLIAEAVMAEGSLRIEDLVDRFGISLMTAHRDLDDLAASGLLRKTRGIVSAAPTSLIESSSLYRASRQSAKSAPSRRPRPTMWNPGKRCSSMTAPRSSRWCRIWPPACR